MYIKRFSIPSNSSKSLPSSSLWNNINILIDEWNIKVKGLITWVTKKYTNLNIFHTRWCLYYLLFWPLSHHNFKKWIWKFSTSSFWNLSPSSNSYIIILKILFFGFSWYKYSSLFIIIFAPCAQTLICMQ